MATPSRAEIIFLFRSLLRSARQFSDYNIREYTKRRTIDSFRNNKTLSDPSSIAAAFSDGQSQLQVAKRQAPWHGKRAYSGVIKTSTAILVCHSVV
ncbi:hypothetical protein E3N88_25519 [Mikania micrantha]|uniref:Complex 1 LYR protein domain-containing protein n=1 Tax=Mikania micrantha TaxID=192012 RepID=A0A5N6N7R8_9ASTR|nr:hypothetical protein E3N88_25519 [Mikania micrantha]